MAGLETFLPPGGAFEIPLLGAWPPLPPGSYRFIGQVAHPANAFLDESQVIFNLN